MNRSWIDRLFFWCTQGKKDKVQTDELITTRSLDSTPLQTDRNSYWLWPIHFRSLLNEISPVFLFGSA